MFPGESPKSGPVALHDVTPLLVAAASSSPELVKTLLDAGADVNAKDGRGMTPLMLAVATNHQNPAVIRMLLDRGANVDVQSNAGETAADWARKVGAACGSRAAEGRARPRRPPPAAPRRRARST